MIDVIQSKYAKVWLKSSDSSDYDYCYGGTRIIPSDFTDDEALKLVSYLQSYESGIKNTLINVSLQQKVLAKLSDRLPHEFLNSCVGGGRCIIKPNNIEIANILSDVKHPEFIRIIKSIFHTIGVKLNSLNGHLKLTPDFGKYAGISDILYKYTDHVLGINCDIGGCGGKASYTSTGINQAIKTLGYEEQKNIPITLIGAAGACGEGVLSYLLTNGFTNIAVCDYKYDHINDTQTPPSGALHLKSIEGIFTRECLERSGLIIATTFGNELLNSDLELLQGNTTIFLAHNNSLPSGEDGAGIVDNLSQKTITIIPGQILTFGGALTSRIEWFWRLHFPESPFDKNLAHEIVKITMDYWIDKLYINRKSDINPYRYIANLEN